MCAGASGGAPVVFTMFGRECLPAVYSASIRLLLSAALPELGVAELGVAELGVAELGDRESYVHCSFVTIRYVVG